ncbi:MAG TPA: peptidase M56 [Desulfosporosinus sp.]|nr:peptidase M56 [Desulfosporosinus sp.]
MKKIYEFVILIIVISLLGGCGIQGTSKTPSENQVFLNQEFHVSLQYPSTWKANNNYSPARYEGDNGYFQISAFDGKGWSIDQVAESDANHLLKPYGTTPSITKLEIQGKEVRLIKPSEDQPKEEKQKAELIIKYSKPIQINSDEYYYFVLWSDKQHIEEIAKTIKFID